MSSVHAVTQNIQFNARVASFYPIETEELLKEFQELLVRHGQKQNFIVWRVEVLSNIKDFNKG